MTREKIASLAAKFNEEVIGLRHFFHSRPEIAWEEVETSRKIESLLKEWGFENIRRGVRGTECGVTADLNAGEKGPAIALRADMDALAIKEENDLPYVSKNEGVMHACGHDSHMAILLGASKVLASMKEELPGKVRFIFQPAEEYGLVSGAEHMIREGALEGIDAIAGLHIWSPLESGLVAVRSGPVMASCDSWTLSFFGKGGHGAMPQDAVDPTLAASTFVNLLQTIVSREVNPQEVVVVSVGKFVTGSAFNIIPDSVEIVGTARTFNNDIQNALPGMIQRISDGISSALRCRAKLEYTKFTPAAINDSELTQQFIETAERTLGEQRIQASPMVMVSEDFSYYQQKIPGVFFFLGCGNKAKGTDNPHHSPRFNVDDNVLQDGVALLASFAMDFLSGSR
ncbi:MAG: M20 family metallopeptidase [Thermovirgaceae bacterium]